MMMQMNQRNDKGQTHAYDMMQANNVAVIDYSSPDEHLNDEEDQVAGVIRRGKNDPRNDNYDDDSSLEEGELNSAQKQKLKNDLLRMGYDEDEEEFGATAGDGDDDEDDDDDDEEIA